MKHTKKRTIRIISVLTFIMLAAAIFTLTVSASEDDGYYYESIDIVMEVGTDKSVNVTERLTVYFEEDRHGIIRNIPTESLLEKYEITDAYVVGDPYTYYDGVFKIGDADRTVRGRHSYTICYTINLYADASAEFDFFYPNLIGNEFDTEILSAEATIIFPENAEVIEYNVTSGEYGSTANPYARAKLEENTIKVKSKHALPAFNGISIEVRLNEGAFPDAPVLHPDIVIDNLDVSISTNEYGEMQVTENYSVTSSVPSGRFVRTLDDNLDTKNSGAQWYVNDITVSCGNYPEAATTYSNDVIIDIGAAKGNSFDFTISYKIITDISDIGENGFAFSIDLANSSVNIQLNNASVVLDTDKLSSAYINSEFRERFSMKTAFDSEVDSKAATFRLKDPLGIGDRVVLKLNYPEDTFKRAPRIFDWLAPLCAAAILAIVILMRVTKHEKPLVPAIEYYPPDGLSPAEMGYIIDGEISGEDITSLVFYWASHGHINIEFPSKSSFVLHFVSPLDSDHPDYERTMFDSLWRYGMGSVVSSAQLSEKFYVSVYRAANAVKRIYKKNRALIDTKRSKQSVIMSVVSLLIPMLICLIATVSFRFSVSSALIAIIAAIGCAIFAQLLLRHARSYKHKNSKGKTLALYLGAAGLLIGFVLLSMLCSQAVSVFGWLITAICVTISVCLSPGITKLTDYGADMLSKCIGFKQFLETAERERLEMLLEQDPDYYYNILPYAQVLGVSDIWEKKFKDLVTTPPTWYVGGYTWGDIYFTHIMLNSMRSVSRSMTSVPSNNTPGGSGGFGGGGFGGGGFSGGGFGGGGGSSW